jgi:hypothetical protein
MVAGIVYGQRGRDLWENNNMLYGIETNHNFKNTWHSTGSSLFVLLLDIAKQRYKRLA